MPRLTDSPLFLRTLIAVGVAGALIAAARPTVSHAAPQGGAVVQVRDFEKASTVDVVAWNATEPQFGIRTWVRRNGQADRYHYLWVNADYPAIRDAGNAQGLNRPLQVTSLRDDQNCVNGRCSPTGIVRARVPDDALRKATGDVSVKFITNSGAEIVFTARRPLIDAYLASVDSLKNALKK